jgi:hypothetical protein
LQQGLSFSGPVPAESIIYQTLPNARLANERLRCRPRERGTLLSCLLSLTAINKQPSKKSRPLWPLGPLLAFGDVTRHSIADR